MGKVHMSVAAALPLGASVPCRAPPNLSLPLPPFYLSVSRPRAHCDNERDIDEQLPRAARRRRHQHRQRPRPGRHSGRHHLASCIVGQSPECGRQERDVVAGRQPHLQEQHRNGNYVDIDVLAQQDEKQTSHAGRHCSSDEKDQRRGQDWPGRSCRRGPRLERGRCVYRQWDRMFALNTR